MKNCKHAANKTKGFTLVEMLAVILVVGIISGIIATIYTSSGAVTSRAQALGNFADRGTDLITLINSQLGVPANVSTNPIIESGNNYLDILMAGDIAVDAQYVTDYNNSGAGTLDRMAVETTAPAAGTPGVYEVEGYAVTLSSPSDDVAQFDFANVPSNIVEVLVEERDPSTAFAPGTADTSGAVQYTAAASGTHTLTLETSIR